jgi:hypothetical protein
MSSSSEYHVSQKDFSGRLGCRFAQPPSARRQSRQLNKHANKAAPALDAQKQIYRAAGVIRASRDCRSPGGHRAHRHSGRAAGPMGKDPPIGEASPFVITTYPRVDPPPIATAGQRLKCWYQTLKLAWEFRWRRPSQFRSLPQPAQQCPVSYLLHRCMTQLFFGPNQPIETTTDSPAGRIIPLLRTSYRLVTLRLSQ